MKINYDRDQIYDGSENWPLGTPDFGSFFRYDHMEKAGISYRIEKYQKRSIQLWDNLSLFRITTLEMMIKESNKRLDFNSANFLFFYNYSKQHYKIYTKLETEFFKFLDKLFYNNKYNHKVVSKIGIFLINLTECDNFVNCRKLRNYFEIFFGNGVLLCYKIQKCLSYPFNLKFELTASGFDADKAIEEIVEPQIFEVSSKIEYFQNQLKLKNTKIKFNKNFIQKLNFQKFDPRNYKNSIIIYTADYCFHCHAIIKKFENVAQKLQNFTFFHVKTDLEQKPKLENGQAVMIKSNVFNHQLLTKRFRLPFEGFPAIYIFINYGKNNNFEKYLNIWMKNEDEILQELNEF